MKGKRKNTSDIDFGRDKVTVYLTEYEYERIESVGRGGFNDDRAVKGMLRTFAAIRLYGLAAETTGFVPVHSDIFKKIAGARNYARYRDALKAGGEEVEADGHEFEVTTVRDSFNDVVKALGE